VAQAKVDAERLKTQAEVVLTATLKRREEQAVERIAQAEATALKDVRDQAIDLAIGVATKLIEDKMTKKVQNDLVKDASDDLMKKFHH
jgi:F-type H+-transporting ATPase subunit b